MVAILAVAANSIATRPYRRTRSYVQVSGKKVAGQLVCFWFVLGTITLNGTATTVKRLEMSRRLVWTVRQYLQTTVSVPFKVIVPKTNQLTCHSFTRHRYLAVLRTRLCPVPNRTLVYPTVPRTPEPDRTQTHSTVPLNPTASPYPLAANRVPARGLFSPVFAVGSF